VIKRILATSLIVCMLMSSVPVRADVILLNEFWYQNTDKMIGEGRTFCVSSPDGYVSAKREPGSEVDVADPSWGTVYQNGEIVVIGSVYLHEGEYWGNTPEGHGRDGIRPTGWIPMSNLLLMYTNTDFEKEHGGEFYSSYSAAYGKALSAEKLVVWQWPGSDRPKRIMDNSAKIVPPARYFFKDSIGREWAYITVEYVIPSYSYFGPLRTSLIGWVCLSDPENPNLPALFPAPAPIKWSLGLIPEWSPAEVPLYFSGDAAYNIPDGFVGTAINAVDVSGGAGGGKEPYSFAKIGVWPSWLSISAEGVISGVRPAMAQTATSIGIMLTDSTGTFRSIYINVGAVVVTDYSIATSNVTTPTPSSADNSAEPGDDGGGFNLLWLLVGGGALVALCLILVFWRKH